MKTKKDNNVTNRTSAVYVENKTKLSLSIWQDAVCDEN